MSERAILTSNQDLRGLIGAAIAALNAHNLEAWMGFYADDALHYQPSRGEPLRGRAAIREDYLVATWLPFPDFHFELERVFSEGQWVCVEGTFTGTHEGPLPGSNGEVVEPTHRSVRIPICLVVKVEKGKALEVHEYNDQLGLVTQLGLA